MGGLRTILVILLFAAALQAAGEEYVIEKVCTSSVRRYRVDGEPGSTYAWLIDNQPVVNNNPQYPLVRNFTAVDLTTGMPKQGSEIIIQWENPGVFNLSVVQTSMFSCDTLEQGNVEVFELPEVIAGDPLSICSSPLVELTTAVANHASATLWTSSGDGLFDNPTALHTNYNFGVADRIKGKVELTLIAQGLGSASSCPASSSTLAVTLKSEVILVTNNPDPVCPPQTIDLSAASVTQGSEDGLTFRYFADRYSKELLPDYKAVSQDGTYYIVATNQGGCSALDSVEVVFTPLYVPTFASIPDLCLNEDPPVLPPSDFTGISGKWTPSVVTTNELGTKSYTFVPDPGQCAGELIVVVNVSNSHIPRFNPISACQGETAPTLPKVSLNGIVGTWSPSNISTEISGTFPYVFTPDPDGCGEEVTLMVEIRDIPIPTFNFTTTTLCLNSVPPQLPFTTTSGVPGTWQPAVISTNVPGNFAYTFTPEVGRCTDKGTLVIIVNQRQKPQFDPIAPLCYDSEKELPLTSKEGIKGTWLPSSTVDTRQTGITTYTFIPDDALCAETLELPVEVYQPIALQFKYTPLQVYGSTTDVTVSASGGSGNYTSGTGIYNLPSGWHAFTVMDDLGCSVTDSVYINEKYDLTVTTRILDIMDCPTGTTSVEINVTGGTKPYRYSYDGGVPNQYAFNDSTYYLSASAFYYEFKVVDANGLFGPAEPLLITAPEGFKMTGTFTSPTCYGSSDGTATVNVSNEYGTLTYKWDDPLVQRGSTAYGLKAGTYKVEVTDECGTKTLTVVVPEAPQVVLGARAIASTCFGSDGNIDFTFTNVPDGKYELSYNEGQTFADVQVTGNKAMVSAPPGEYMNLRINVKGCISAEGVSVTVLPAVPQVVLATQIKPDCTTPTATIIVTTPRANSGFQYSKDDGVTWQALSFFTGLKADTTYRIRVQKAGCVSDYLEVTVDPVPLQPMAPIASNIIHPTCSSPTGSVELSGLPAGNWTIRRTPGGIALSGSKPSITFSNLLPGTYRFTVTNADGCNSPESAEVVIKTAPDAPGLALESILQPKVCGEQGSILLAFTHVPDGTYTITHSAGSFNNVVVASGKATIPAKGGTYIDLQISVNGCNSPLGVNAELTDPSAPEAPLIAGTPTQPKCGSPTGSIQLTGLPTGTWTLTRIPGGITTTGTGTSTTISALDPGSYQFTVANAAGCISGASAVMVIDEVPGLPVLTASVIQPEKCGDKGTILMSFTGVPDGTYTLSHSTGSFTGVPVKDHMASVSAPAGMYSDLRITVDLCTSDKGVYAILTDPLAPDAPLVADIQMPSCTSANGSVVLSGLPTGEWTINPGNISGNTPAHTVTGLAANTVYYFTVTSAEGCTSAPSAAVDTHVLPPDAPLVSNLQMPSCTSANGSVLLSGLPAGEWKINPGNISGNTPTHTVTGLAANTVYYFTVTSAEGCTSAPSAPIDTHVPSAVAPTAMVTQQPDCYTPTGNIRVSAPLPDSGISYILTNALGVNITNATGLFEGLAPGSYSIKVMDLASGCESAETTQLIQALPGNPATPVAMVKEEPTCNNPDGTVVVNHPLGADLRYSMDGGEYQASTTFAGLRTGDHTLLVKNVKTGCISAEGTIYVPAIPPPPVLTAVAEKSICNGGTGIITFTATNAKPGDYIITYDGGQFNVNITSSDAPFKVQAAVGTYNNLVIEANGCSSYHPDKRVSAVVAQPSPMVITEDIMPINLAAHTKGAITIRVQGGNGNYTYSWSTGETTKDISNLDEGEYTVTVTDENGCQQDKIIRVPPPNTLPKAVDDYFPARCNIISGYVVLNDTDKEGDDLFIGTTAIVRPQHGELFLSKDGAFEYRADPMFTGKDSFTYALFDKNNYPGIHGTVVLEVFPDADHDGVDDPPLDDLAKGDKDADGDGLLNALDGYDDADGDGFANYLDIDSDGDGIPDYYEIQQPGRYVKPAFLDVNNNGVDDAYDNLQFTPELTAFDSDKDGTPDYLDLDSDNDLIPDITEGNDGNSDGRPDHTALGKDSDGDGLDDRYDTYFLECDPMENILRSNAAMQDFEGDGLPDWRDDNDDDDEYLTRYEDMDGDNDFSNDDFDYDGRPEYLDYGRACELFVPDAFSPNNDGVHDTYMIYCINHFPNAKIYIFDQLGNKLFEKANYGNLEVWGTDEKAWWNGRADRGGGRGDLVPPGTYYYVLDLGNGEVKKSFVFVSY